MGLAGHAVHVPGPKTVKNGDRAVWEPFFLMHEGKLILHFSYRHDEKHAQKLAGIAMTSLKD